MPSLRQLQCFLALADLGSFTAAAERLHLAQPALSRQIMNLEEELGQRLFERHSRLVRITPAGVRLRDRARRILDDLESACAEVRTLSGAEDRLLRVLHSSSTPLLGPLGTCLGDWLAAHPGLRLEVGQATSEHQIDEIADGRADLGFVRLPVLRRDTRVVIRPILKEALLLALPPGHRLAGSGPVPMAELAGEAFVFTPHPDRGGLSRAVYEHCQQAGLQPRPARATSRKASLLHLIGLGQGIGLIPASMALQVPAGVVLAPLAEPAWTQVALVHRIPGQGQAVPGLEAFLNIAA